MYDLFIYLFSLGEKKTLIFMYMHFAQVGVFITLNCTTDQMSLCLGVCTMY